MTTQKIVAYDPGYATGVATGVFSDTEPLQLTDAYILTYESLMDVAPEMLDFDFDHVVVEKFTLRTNNEFAADLIGVRVEGILDLMYGDQIVWRERTKKEQVPDALLKEHELWQEGSDVDWEDGRDANDAIIHMLGYVAFDLGHRPTLGKYFR